VIDIRTSSLNIVLAPDLLNDDGGHIRTIEVREVRCCNNERSPRQIGELCVRFGTSHLTLFTTKAHDPVGDAVVEGFIESGYRGGAGYHQQHRSTMGKGSSDDTLVANDSLAALGGEELWCGVLGTGMAWQWRIGGGTTADIGWQEREQNSAALGW
jgi:hypothetical protein